jgi:putative transposase
MAWESFKVEQQRLQVILSYIEGKCSMTDLCIKYGISRKTAYKWYHRFLEEGEEGLKDQSKSPHIPYSIYNEDQIKKAIDLKMRYRNWGPKKILVKLKEFYPNENWPCPTRLYEIFNEYNLVTKKKIRSRVPATAPLGGLLTFNDTWSVDFKGWFLTGDGQRCEPLTITDNFTRYLIRCTHVNRRGCEYVWPILEEAFKEYGLPNRVRSDNGAPFGSVGIGRLTKLSIKLIQAGVLPEWIRPGHPEENGRHERFHLTLKQNVAKPPKDSLVLQIQAMREFQEEYNFERPHEALSMKTPGNCYQSSPRIWDGILRSPEYDTKQMQVRKVQKNANITFCNRDHHIGEALMGEYIGLKPINNEEFEIFYGPLLIGKLTEKGVEKPQMKKRRSNINMINKNNCARV